MAFATVANSPGSPALAVLAVRFPSLKLRACFESARSERFERLWGAIVRGTRECERSCAHYGFCGGGAPVNKLYENGELASAETLYCRTMLKRPFDAVLARLEKGRELATLVALAERATP